MLVIHNLQYNKQYDKFKYPEIGPCRKSKVLKKEIFPIKTVINSKRNLLKKYYSPETALWQAVIIQAFEDATSNSQKKKLLRYKKRAIKWLQEEDENLKNICLLAGIKFSKVKRLANIVFCKNH